MAGGREAREDLNLKRRVKEVLDSCGRDAGDRELNDSVWSVAGWSEGTFDWCKIVFTVRQASLDHRATETH